MNIQEATPMEVMERERSALEAMIRSAKTEHGLVERALSARSGWLSLMSGIQLSKKAAVTSALDAVDGGGVVRDRRVSGDHFTGG